MGKLFCIIGGTCVGKDTIINSVLDIAPFSLDRLITYTTRPKRGNNEIDGEQYHFVDKDFYFDLKNSEVVEERSYDTEFGTWYYFTMRKDLDFADNKIVASSTVQFKSYREVLNIDAVPIVITSTVKNRILRYMDRLDNISDRDDQDIKHLEMCRRILSDEEEYTKDKMKQDGIWRTNNVFTNNYHTPYTTIQAVVNYMQDVISSDNFTY